MPKNPNKLFVFGFGYTAQTLAALAKNEGWEVAGTSRSPETRQRLKALGYQAVDFTPEAVTPLLQQATHLLVSTPLNRDWQDPVLLAFEPLIRASSLQWIGYLSTTGVYGDHQGAWVEEATPAKPTNPRGHGRLRAEAQWLALGEALRVPAQVFRLAGIYGPGRNALTQLKDGNARPIYKEGQVFSRIHVDDIARVLLASIQKAQGGEIYNVCDDLPAPSHEVIEYAAGLLSIPPPERIPFENANLSEMGKEFYESSRRVKNDKIKRELGVTLQYPTYREGLLTMLEKGE